ncbi:hypothetical protein IIA29_03080 [candidate division KSB1 bacterium]|nr:hypothetical protein [candidate division KSB1 bacterium]
MIPKHVEVINAFAKYVRQNVDKSLIEEFTREEIEDAIAKNPQKDVRLYEAMMRRRDQLNRLEEQKQENKKLLIGFISGVVLTLLVQLLAKLF